MTNLLKNQKTSETRAQSFHLIGPGYGRVEKNKKTNKVAKKQSWKEKYI